MKIGAIGLGNRIAHVYHELSKINQDADLVAFVDPQPIGCLLYTSPSPRD